MVMGSATMGEGFDAIPNAWMTTSFKRELNEALARALHAPTELAA